MPCVGCAHATSTLSPSHASADRFLAPESSSKRLRSEQARRLRIPDFESEVQPGGPTCPHANYVGAVRPQSREKSYRKRGRACARITAVGFGFSAKVLVSPRVEIGGGASVETSDTGVFEFWGESHVCSQSSFRIKLGHGRAVNYWDYLHLSFLRFSLALPYCRDTIGPYRGGMRSLRWTPERRALYRNSFTTPRDRG